MTKKIISVEIPEELKERLRVEAFNQGVTVSKLIRQLLEAGLMQLGAEVEYGKS